jgi:hypothetical protein
LGKGMECSTTNAPLEGPFCCCILPGPGRRVLPSRQQDIINDSCQSCCSHSGSGLVYAWQKLEESPISPLRMSPFCVFFLLIFVSSLSGDPQASDCDSCRHNYLSGKCCHQNSGFYKLLLCRQSCWVMQPQPYHLLSVLSL